MSPMARFLAAAVVLLLVLSAAPARAADTPALWDAAGVSRAASPHEAPSFALPDLEGRRTALESFRGRVVLLYFWATW
jgi:cytochrome oxidase Cu insertion factor (SCO1/SenC/PrrC family)